VVADRTIEACPSVFIWPVADETRQLELFCEKVRPAVAA
jgi:hypothetical protein